MKKNLLFLSLLMIFAPVLFTGCDGLFGGGNELTKVKSFEVEDDSAVEMTYTASSDDAMLRAMVVMGQAQEGEEASEYQTLFTTMKEYMNYAKISEAQIIALADLIEANESLGDIFGEDDIDPSSAQITQILDFYKAVIGIIGNDAAGKFAYQMALQAGGSNKQITEMVEAFGYDGFIVNSRMAFAIINSVVWSIDSSDITLISALSESEEEPTNAEIVQLIGIVSDSLEASILEENVWTQYYSIMADKMENIILSIPEETYPSSVVFVTEDLIEMIKKQFEFLGTYATINLKFRIAVLNQIDEEAVEIFRTKTNKNYARNVETQLWEWTYYIGEEEISEDEYNKHPLKQYSLGIGLSVQAYNSFSNKNKTKLLNEIKDILEVFNDQLEEQADEVYIYTDDISTFDDVMDKLEDLASLNYDSLTFEQAQIEFEDAEVILLQYIGSQAPYVYLQISESMNLYG